MGLIIKSEIGFHISSAEGISKEGIVKSELDSSIEKDGSVTEVEDAEQSGSRVTILKGG